MLGETTRELIEVKSGVISILCPTRGRPEQVNTMIQSALATATKPKNIEFCFYIDKDDESYKELIFNGPENQVKIMRGPRMWLSSMYNSLITSASGEYFFWSGDDVEFLTEGWDEKIIEAFNAIPSKIAVVHVNDMATSYPQKYATIGAVHVNWVKAFGYIFTPHMRDNGIDFWISDVANQIGRRVYLANVHVDHRQYRQGKVEIDQTYSDRLEDHKTYDPMRLYYLLRNERRRDALMLSSIDKSIKVENRNRFFLARTYLKFSTVLQAGKISTKRKVYVGSLSNSEIIAFFLQKIRITKRKNLWDY